MSVNTNNVKQILKTVYPSTLVVATKYANLDDLKILHKLGVTNFGENRVVDFLDKYNNFDLSKQIDWHFIGTLQTNKVKLIIDKTTLIHSVDSYKLIDEIQKQANKKNIISNILIQVNIANENSKHGFKAEQIEKTLKYLTTCNNIKNHGFMIIAPNIPISQTEIYFKQIKKIFDLYKKQYHLTHLSMGMSNDYQMALNYGSTLIRVGSILFKN